MTRTYSLEGVRWQRYASMVTGILPFLSSSVHFDWCTRNENFQVKRMEKLLEGIRNNSYESQCFDVGMNDGFYTMLMAASGCIVNSFEVQPLCIDIAHMSMEKNEFENNITIHNRPVSNKHEKKLTFPMGKGCDGGYRINGHIGQRMGHLKQFMSTNTSFYSFAIDSVKRVDNNIHILKIDTEGHDFNVLSGALDLIRLRKINAIFMEMHVNVKRTFENNIVTSTLFKSGYRGIFIGNPDCGIATSLKEFWKIALQKRHCVDVFFEKM